MLGIGSSALIAYRRALDTVSNNIANVDTEGYSRQRAEFTARGGILQVRSPGGGVDVWRVQRITDNFLANRLIGEQSAYTRLNTLQSFSSEVDGWLSSADAGISKPLQGFFDDVTAMASNPSSIAQRQAMLNQADDLAVRFKDFQSRFDDLDRELTSRIDSSVTQINQYAKQLADLNKAISSQQLASGGAPNELLDQRQRVLKQLSESVGVTTHQSSDGTVSVFLAGGQALVEGTRANSLELSTDVFGRPRDLSVASGSQAGTIITNRISGGELGGLLDFRRNVLDPAINSLGRVALTLANAVNEQNRQGVDLYGDMGGDLFTIGSGTAASSELNTGNAVVTVGATDTNALTPDDYTLRYDGTNWTMTAVTTGVVTTLSGDGSPGNPLTGGGLSLTLTGAAQAGDQFLVQPTRFLAGSIGLNTQDPKRIAAAAPMQTLAATSNAGTGFISPISVVDVNDPAFRDPVSIQFTGPGTYSINGVGSYPYTAGDTITVNGWSVQIGGEPATGDQFDITPTGADSGDNGNANIMAKISELKLLDNGVSTLSVANSNVVAHVGAQALQYSNQADAQNVLLQSTQNGLDAAAGVNLDEEAADMTRFEQAYNAAAQIIATASSLFDTLIAAVRS
jgi:flagellar hook-associated protein 1 FlgK